MSKSEVFRINETTGEYILDSERFVKQLSEMLGYEVQQVFHPADPVKCSSVALKARYSSNTERVLKELHGIDIVKEILFMLAQEIADDIKMSGKKLTHFWQIVGRNGRIVSPTGESTGDNEITFVLRGAFGD